MVTVQELFNVMPLWRVAHLLDFESAQVVCEFLHDEAVRIVGMVGRRDGKLGGWDLQQYLLI